MKYEEISVVIRKFVGFHEGLRKLGFPADTIFYEVAGSALRGGVLSGFCTLKTKGKTFRIELGDVDEELSMKEYGLVTEAIRNGSLNQADMDRIWQENPAHLMALAFMTSIVNKGFRLPRHVS